MAEEREHPVLIDVPEPESPASSAVSPPQQSSALPAPTSQVSPNSTEQVRTKRRKNKTGPFWSRGHELPEACLVLLQQAIIDFRNDGNSISSRREVNRQIRSALEIAFASTGADTSRSFLEGSALRTAVDRVRFAISSWGDKLEPLDLIKNGGVGDIVGSFANAAVLKPYYRASRVVVRNDDGTIKHSLDFVDYYEHLDVPSYKLPNGIARTLYDGLRDEGLSEAEAAIIARTITNDFDLAATFSLSQIKAVAQIASVAFRAQGRTTVSFDDDLKSTNIYQLGKAAADAREAARQAGLPRGRPTYASRADKSVDAIKFLRDTWGDIIDIGAGFYQDDLHRLGETTLVQAVRSRVNYLNRKIADDDELLSADEILPPPDRQRIWDALAQCDPYSPEAFYYGHLLTMRGLNEGTRKPSPKR